jgi:4-diphosphocytidyl-2-C-methyl-D-erythritol kinase
MATRVRSFCKINLGLRVGPTRVDGFHGLTTFYQSLALHDMVTVEAHPAESTTITLGANHPGVPRTETGDAERNTAHRMIALALQQRGIRARVHIEIDKRLPVQGGLGAGSANAVAALLGLERELARQGIDPLPGPDRLQLAAEVGSDVPLFLLGGSVLGLGRGEQVVPLPDIPVTACVVAVPKVGVSTAAAFRDLDARMAAESRNAGASLTSEPVVDKLEQLSRALAACYTQTGSMNIRMDGVQTGTDSGIASQSGDLAELKGPPSDALNGAFNSLLALVRTGIENDFEEVAFTQHPSLRSTKRDLMGEAPGSLETGSGSALYAALSGSGSALFGLYRSLDDAHAAQQRVQRNGTEAFLTETLPRSEYWKRMFA